MKFNFTTPFEVSDFESKLKMEKHVKCKILNQIDNPSGKSNLKTFVRSMLDIVEMTYWLKNPKCVL